jgi:hypothetical protein
MRSRAVRDDIRNYLRTLLWIRFASDLNLVQEMSYTAHIDLEGELQLLVDTYLAIIWGFLASLHSPRHRLQGPSRCGWQVCKPNGFK